MSDTSLFLLDLFMALYCGLGIIVIAGFLLAVCEDEIGTITNKIKRLGK